MARNKYPEKTVKLIVDASLKLFLKKGYESTSIQDIINDLGGLTKGAIYHHFKSKEEILEAVADTIERENINLLLRIRGDNTLCGLDKLRALFRSSLSDSHKEMMLKMAPDIIRNPRFLAMQVQEITDVVAPQYIQPIVEQCISEGNIHTKYPRELSEVIILLANIWLNPLIFKGNLTELMNRIRFFNELLDQMGIDLLDEAMIDSYEQYCNLFLKQSMQ